MEMQKTVVVTLSGHDTGYRLDDPAYDALARYLDRASVRLADDPDRTDIIADLERSIGDRLADSAGPGDQSVSLEAITDILEQVGPVDTGHDTEAPRSDDPAPRRRMARVRDGQVLTGVCMGLADYAEVDVAWVRTFFVLATIFTAGLFGLLYVALIFILPIDSDREPHR
jgi:phage shock protein C